MGLSGRLDLLLGVTDCNRCAEDGQVYSPLCAQNTIFGWSLGGSVEGGKTSDVCFTATSSDKKADEILQRFWVMDEIPGDNDHTTDEQRAIAHFKDTYVMADTEFSCLGRIPYQSWEHQDTPLRRDMSRMRDL